MPPSPTKSATATVILHPLQDSFLENRRITIGEVGGIMLGRAVEGQPPLPTTFDSKVVSRKHAHIFWERNGDQRQFFIQDIGSSSGTFVNNKRLAAQGKISSAQEIHPEDTIRLGDNFESTNASGKKVIEHAAVTFKVSMMSNVPQVVVDDDEYNPAINADIQLGVKAEFDAVWSSLNSHESPFAPYLNSTCWNNALPFYTDIKNALKHLEQSYTGRTTLDANRTTTYDTENAPIPPENHNRQSRSRDSTISRSGHLKETVTGNEVLVGFIQSMRWEDEKVRERALQMAYADSPDIQTIYTGSKGMPEVFQRVMTRWFESVDAD